MFGRCLVRHQWLHIVHHYYVMWQTLAGFCCVFTQKDGYFQISIHYQGCSYIVTTMLQPCGKDNLCYMPDIVGYITIPKIKYSGTSLFQASELWPPLYNSHMLFIPITYTNVMCINLFMQNKAHSRNNFHSHSSHNMGSHLSCPTHTA